MEKLLNYICDEIDELSRKANKENKLTLAEIEYLDTLAHIKKSLLSSEKIMEENDYSMAYESYDPYGRSMRNSSYRRSGGSYRSYAAGRGSNARRDSMGRYSSSEDDFRMGLEDLINDAPNEQVKQKLQRMMTEM